MVRVGSSGVVIKIQSVRVVVRVRRAGAVVRVRRAGILVKVRGRRHRSGSGDQEDDEGDRVAI